MTKGYVYVLSNPSMPGLVKIGRTENDPQIRAGQLYTTGVPGNFKIEFVWYSDDCVALEARLHEAFDRERLHRGREFFKASPQEVIEHLMYVYLSESEKAIVSDEEESNIQHLDYMSSVFGLSPSDLLSAIHMLPVEYVQAAFKAYTLGQDRMVIKLCLEAPDGQN